MKIFMGNLYIIVEKTKHLGWRSAYGSQRFQTPENDLLNNIQYVSLFDPLIF